MIDKYIDNYQQRLKQLQADAELHPAQGPPEELELSEYLLYELQMQQIELGAQNEELRQAQVALEKSRDRYENLYEFAPVGYLSVSRRGVITEVNWKVTAMFGLARRQLTQMHFEEFVADEDKERWQRQFLSMKAFAGGEELSFELKFTHNDGSILEANLNCLRMDDEDEQPILRITLVDITELKTTERKLDESRIKLLALSTSREEARETERKSIAREIHDELGQLLSLLRLNVTTLDFCFGDTPPGLRDKTQKMVCIVDRAILVVRELSTRLRSATLNMGVVSALEWMIQEYAENSSIDFQLNTHTCDVLLDDDRAMVLFRIVQESLTNVLRHSRASRVEISLRCEDDIYELVVSDNGIGFETSKSVRRDAFGIIGMRERAVILGGELNLVSKPGHGTVLQLRIPLTKAFQEA